MSITFVMVLIAVWRFGYTIILNRGLFNEKIILIGSGNLARDIVSEILSKKDSGYTISVRFIEKNECSESEISNNDAIVCRKGYGGLCEIAKGMYIKY